MDDAAAHPRPYRILTTFFFGEEAWPGVDEPLLDRLMRAMDTPAAMVGARDKAMRYRYGKYFARVEEKDLSLLDAWGKSPEGILATILMFDYVSRSAFRGTGKAYKFDKLALAAAERVTAEPFLFASIMALHPSFLLIVIWPFMHAENKHLLEKVCAVR